MSSRPGGSRSRGPPRSSDRTRRSSSRTSASAASPRDRGRRVSDYAIQQVVNALSAGSLYALMAVGLAMVFGILRLINFAHGDVMMIAAYIAFFSIGAGLPFLVAMPVVIVGTVVVGLLMERAAYRPIRGAPDVAMLLSSFAVGQILQNGTLLTTRLAGLPTLIAFPSPDILNGVVTVGAITIPKVNLASFVAGIVLLGLLTVFVTRTSLGLSMRAAAEDLPAARLMGIKVNRVVATAFAIGAGLAAVAGLLYSVQAGQINPYIGFTPVLKAFIAAVIGGFGSIAGAVLGGYVLGFLEVLTTAVFGLGPLVPPGPVHDFLIRWLPSSLASYRDAFVFVILILVLLVRPQGILGKPDREGSL